MVLSIHSQFEKLYLFSISYLYSNLMSPIVSADNATAPEKQAIFNV